jgi:hypothetical protein
MMTLTSIARALGGQVMGSGADRYVMAPGPNHSTKDRSLKVILSDTAPEGFVVHSFSSDDPLLCRDYVRGRLGLPPFKPGRGNGHDREASPNSHANRKEVRRIVYNYCDPKTGAFRYRKTPIEFDDGDKTFFFEKGGGRKNKPLLYGGERLADVLNGQPVLFVEGEKKVERARELGAIAVSGDTGHQSKFAPDQIEHLRGLPIILWPDSDAPGENYIVNAAAAILAKFPDTTIRIVRPGLPNGEKGRDIRDWEGDAEDLVRLFATAVPYEARSEPFIDDRQRSEPSDAQILPNPTKLLSYAEMLALPEGEFLIHGVIVRRAKNVLFGVSNSFKSFMATDMAGSVSTGRTYHGMAVNPAKTSF